MEIGIIVKAEVKDTLKIKSANMMKQAGQFCWNFIASTENSTQ